MKLFPFKKPALGISIGASRLALVELRRGWRASALRRCTERPIPDGVIRLSATEANVTDVPALAKELSALVDARRPVPVALSLSDLCARVAVFEFETLPQKPAEIDALIRWRFQKDLNVAMADARLTYQVFTSHLTSSPSRGEDRGEGAKAVVRVLTVAIRESVMQGYEQACEQAGLIPVSVGLSSLQLFDVYRSAMDAATGQNTECFFLSCSEGSLAFVAIRHGTPVFVRIKAVRFPLPVGERTKGGGSAMSNEVLATVQFYADRHGLAENGATPLFVVGESARGLTIPAALGVTVVPLSAAAAPIRQERVSLGTAGLPALAGAWSA
jgi:hypothetical protein